MYGYGYGWWPDAQRSEEVKRYVECQLDKMGWKVDVVLSHTMPLKYELVEVFMAGVDQSKVDKSTEEWSDWGQAEIPEMVLRVLSYGEEGW